ncbi:MAG TPA: DUF72 domain-containing protein [Dehalococcoidia bacterium]|jgi:uncharacterized protein YecE (DUF72 family)|nr:DUF72 domain-containing protein [Dehalococcoidia bacterium]
MNADKGLPRVKVGCCGFPGGREKYFRQFKLVEVQQTFYKMPKLGTALRWREEAPADFEFTLKAWQLITHPSSSPTYRKAGLKIPPGAEEHYGFFRPGQEVLKAWEETQRFARALRARVIVFQCPASFRETAENIANMRSFFASVRDSGFIFAWEPRGEWNKSVVQDLCAELGLVHCVDPFEGESLYGEPRYFRLHGGPGYRHRYSEEELKGLKDRLGEGESYVLFNNLNMYQDALAFMRLLEG